MSDRLRASARIAVFAAAHFVIALAIAMIAFGTDMDQLPSRSPVSRVAAEIHDALWFPHDSAMRAVPNAWVIRNTWAIPAAIVVNSLVWGTGLWAVSLLVRRRTLHQH